jgi:hypothetical protein
MKKFTSFLGFTALTLAFTFSGYDAAAQAGGFGGGGGGGGIGAMMGDSTQRAQMQVTALRDSLAVTNDLEWNVIAARLTKVVQLKTDDSVAALTRMMAPMIAQFAGGMQGGANPLGGGATDPSASALQTALDNKASTAQVKAALEKFRDAKKQKQAELAKAQDALKEVLSVRQEAALALAGYLE